MKKAHYLFLLLVPIFASGQKKIGDSITYKNPIIDAYLADPCIILVDDTYYLFATGEAPDGDQIPIYSSKNLTDWTFEKGAVQKGDSLSWNFKHFWAPEVHKYNDTYYLYYTASPEDSPSNSQNKVGVASSKNILGPYEDHGPLIPHGSIDGHPFLDTDGKMYFYFTVEQLNSTGLPMGKIYAYTMKDPLTITGEPIAVITKHPWQEGPFVIKKDNEYWMTYSIGAWKNDTYHIVLAKSKHPLGPFEFIEKPLLESTDVVKGPGHHAIFTDKHNQQWIVYHGWDPSFKARYPRIDPLYWKNGMLHCDGPTSTKTTINFPIKK
ncbi:glycoside hydrolase family 43 protein [Mariniflexile sp.]|uniref:glycoside hydrolase family 43 protein n=1 Tax=Mariniflexile sp. TaxID=1979402 RepID=UPI0040481D81